MATPERQKVVMVPYPGRDLAIVSLFFTLLLPIIGPLLGYGIAKTGTNETHDANLEPIGIQKFSLAFAAIVFTLEFLGGAMVFLFITGILTGFLEAIRAAF